MITLLHKGYLGIAETLEIVKDNSFWPGMTKQIIEFVLKSSTCLRYRDSIAYEPMLATDFPSRL